MCKICVEWENNRLTNKEAFGAIGEMINTSKDESQVGHLKDLSERILDKELPNVGTNTEVDEAWWEFTHNED